VGDEDKKIIEKREDPRDNYRRTEDEIDELNRFYFEMRMRR